MGELNRMQTEAAFGEPYIQGNEKKAVAFDNKFTIPLYFLNLILRQYNLAIREE